MPDDLWLGQLELNDDVQGGVSVQMKGYSVDRSSVTDLARRLETIPNTDEVAITYLNLVTENIPEGIPSIYQNELYSFSVNMMVKE
jgi:hypothetical protein